MWRICALFFTQELQVAPLDLFEALDWVAVVMSDGSLPTTLGCVAVG